MGWITPWALALLAAIPAILILYFLRPRFHVRDVPSLMIWQQAVHIMEASAPWQKFRRSLLLLLQLLAALLVALAATQPFFYSGKKAADVILVIDTSFSMQATDVSPSRMQEAKRRALERVSNLASGQRVTVIEAGPVPVVKASRTDIAGARRAIGGLEAGFAAGDLAQALEVASLLQGEMDGAQVAVYTDRAPTQPGGAVWETLAGDKKNAAIRQAAAGYAADGTLSVSCVVVSTRTQGEVVLECRVDGAVHAVKTLSLADGQAAAQFDGIDQKAQLAQLAILTGDDLPSDNRMDVVLGQRGGMRALLATKGNIFLEKALSLREDILVDKLQGDSLPGGYDLYVLDGTDAPGMPDSGHALLFGPGNHVPGLGVGAIKTGSVALSPAVDATSQKLLQYVDAGAIVLSGYTPLELSGGWQPLLYAGQDVAAAFCITDSGCQVAFGFDLHASNLPLLKDYPILMQNLLSFLLPPVVPGETISCGQPVTFGLQPSTVEAFVVLPDGSKTALEVSTRATFDQTAMPGVYRVVQRLDGQGEGRQVTDAFAVAPAITGESLEDMPAPAFDGQGDGAQGWSMLSILPYLAVLAAFIMMAEWGVQHAGRH
nr:VWA domain-containing protein [bacterium]